MITLQEWTKLLYKQLEMRERGQLAGRRGGEETSRKQYLYLIGKLTILKKRNGNEDKEK